MHVADGSIESPAQILQTLRAKNIPSEHCIVLAKAALHDRTVDNTIRTYDGAGSQHQTAGSMEAHDEIYVYRDEDWRQVAKYQVIEDMVVVLNAWKKEIPTAKLIILESHLLPTRIINEQIERIALLPAYISHSLSAQYMLPAKDHRQATKRTNYKEQLFIPIHVMPDKNALMSVTLLEG